MIELLVYVAGVGAIAVAGIWIGLRLAPQIGTWFDRQQERDDDER